MIGWDDAIPVNLIARDDLTIGFGEIALIPERRCFRLVTGGDRFNAAVARGEDFVAGILLPPDIDRAAYVLSAFTWAPRDLTKNQIRSAAT